MIRFYEKSLIIHMNTYFQIIQDSAHRIRIVFARTLFVSFLFVVPCMARAQTSQMWFSLQKSDLRSGTSSATVNTNGTLITTNYATGCTYIRGYTSKDLNFNAASEYDMGTSANGTSSDVDAMRLLTSFDLTPVMNAMGDQAYSITAVNLILTCRTTGQGWSSSMSLYTTTPFAETTATWNNPGSGAPAGGTLETLLQSQSIAGSTMQYPSNVVWNSAALLTAVQDAINNPTNNIVYFLGKRGTEGDDGHFARYVTDENTDPTYGGVDGRPELQVQVTIYSNTPLVSVSAPDPDANESGTNTGMFTITRSIITTNDLTVYYHLSGSATAGTDYQLNPALSGSVVLPAGVTSTNIIVQPLDVGVIEDNKTVTMTLIHDPNDSSTYGISAGSATVTIMADNIAGVYVQYLFGGTFSPTIFGSGVDATPVASNPIWGFSAVEYLTPPDAGFINGNNTTNNETGALTQDYGSFTLTPQPTNGIVLTNLELSAYYDAIHSLDANAASATVFVRSSLDDYSNDLGSVTLTADNLGGGWDTLDFPLGTAFSNLTSSVTFRIYVYDDMTNAGTSGGVRIDNLFVRGYPAVLPAGVQKVSISATSPNAAKPSTPGAFTVTRYGSTSDPLTVNYSIGGTASNGVDYVQLSGQVTFGAGEAYATIPVTPIDDPVIKGTETVVLTLLPDPGYTLLSPSTATVTIADNPNDPTQSSVVASDDNAYERNPLLTGAFTITRLGDTNSDTTVNFSFGGTATLGVDYLASATNSVTIPAGQLNKTVTIIPMNNTLMDGTKMVNLTLQPSSDYDLFVNTNATVYVYQTSTYDEDLSSGSVLWSDKFDSGSSSNNYSLTWEAANGLPDYLADFAFDYGAAGIPFAPGSTNGIGLKMTANKNDDVASAAAVNVYPIGQSFSNNFALRFDLYLNYDPAGTNGEMALFGLGQQDTTTNCNWNNASPLSASGQGVWVALEINDQDSPSVQMWALTNNASTPAEVIWNIQTNLAVIFNSPPFGVPGAMGNPYNSTNKTWVAVELSQVAGVITLKLDGAVALTYTNNNMFYTNGDVFLGYNDQYPSIGSAQGYAIFDNVRVVQVTTAPVIITQIKVNNGLVTVNFTGDATDTPSSFQLQSSGSVNGPYADDNSAVISGTGGVFQASSTVSGTMRFYRIRRN